VQSPNQHRTIRRSRKASTTSPSLPPTVYCPFGVPPCESCACLHNAGEAKAGLPAPRHSPLSGTSPTFLVEEFATIARFAFKWCIFPQINNDVEKHLSWPSSLAADQPTAPACRTRVSR
jgi:hypothetical protein